MTDPPGPTGIITLKKIGDLTYEQYGKIQMSATGLTQIFITTDSFTTWFEQRNVEKVMTWIEEFPSRLQGTANPNQSSFYNVDISGRPGGAWAHGTNTGGSPALTETTLLDGAGRLRLTTIAVALPQANLVKDETANTQQITSHVSRNPTFYMRWAQTASTTSAAVSSIGWHRGSEGFTNPALVFGGIYFRAAANSDILAVCVTRVGSTQFETTRSMGVTMSPGVFHTGRLVVTGGGTAVECFIDGLSKGSITTNIPTESGGFALSPGFGATNANVDLIDVDYMALSQQRTP